jgi:hypothetical protein
MDWRAGQRGSLVASTTTYLPDQAWGSNVVGVGRQGQDRQDGTGAARAVRRWRRLNGTLDRGMGDREGLNGQV